MVWWISKGSSSVMIKTQCKLVAHNFCRCMIISVRLASTVDLTTSITRKLGGIQIWSCSHLEHLLLQLPDSPWINIKGRTLITSSLSECILKDASLFRLRVGFPSAQTACLLRVHQAAKWRKCLWSTTSSSQLKFGPAQCPIVVLFCELTVELEVERCLAVS